MCDQNLNQREQSVCFLIYIILPFSSIPFFPPSLSYLSLQGIFQIPLFGLAFNKEAMNPQNSPFITRLL